MKQTIIIVRLEKKIEYYRKKCNSDRGDVLESRIAGTVQLFFALIPTPIK